jgi:hypothetical protein
MTSRVSIFGSIVNFFAGKNRKTNYLQCAYVLTDPVTIDREYTSLKAIPDNFEKYVVSMDDFRLESNEGIGHCQAWRLNEIL